MPITSTLQKINKGEIDFIKKIISSFKKKGFLEEGKFFCYYSTIGAKGYWEIVLKNDLFSNKEFKKIFFALNKAFLKKFKRRIYLFPQDNSLICSKYNSLLSSSYPFFIGCKRVDFQ